MKPIAYIGADPGLSGALVLYVPASHENTFVEDLVIADMPVIKADDGSHSINLWGLASILSLWTSMYFIKKAVIEKVHAIPNYTRKDGKKQGISSSASFSFGFSAGALQQAFVSAGIDAALAHPATWKAVYGLRGGKENKGLSRDKASVLFPGAAHRFKRVKDDGRAEAALLAHYGSKLG